MHISALPIEIVIKILLLLPSRSIAAACIAIRKWEKFIRTPFFLRKHSERFKQLSDSIYLCVLLKKMDNYKYMPVKGPCYDCIIAMSKTKSNHCITCLLQPHLLCLSLEYSGCSCIDHLFLWDSIDNIIWGKRNISSLNVWPQCSEEILSEKETEAKRARLSQKITKSNCVFDL